MRVKMADKETDKRSPEEDDFEEDNIEVRNDPVPPDDEDQI